MFSRISISRMFSVLLIVAMLIGSGAFPTSVRADSIITVNSFDDNIAVNGFCTLREAITNANNNAATYGDCVAGSGNDTIIFASGLGSTTITLTSTLPTIIEVGGLTIDGDNRITLSGNDSVQVLYVSAPLILQNISVTHGNATSGGGGLFNEGTLTIIHSAFSNNSTIGGGGGVGNLGTLTVTNSTFSNNSATGDGGGVANIGGTLTVTNSTFSNNSANGGGGMINNSGTATILNSTFSGNSVTYDGGGIATWNGGSTPPTTTIRNTILANSTGGYDDCFNHIAGSAVLIGGNNIIEMTSSCNSIATITSNPNLGSLTGSPAYFALNAGSPAIDAGDDATCVAAPVSNTSQNGITRPQGAHCDIGAYEFSSGGDTTGVFRPGNGLLYLKNANTTGFADVAINYGTGGDYPIAGDWDGNGTATIGIYRNGSFYLRNSNTPGFADIVFAFGTPGDQPVAGDWDGDGVDTIGVYSNGQFLLRNNNSAGAADMSFTLGNPGDIGIAGDWNGDGSDTTGVFRPSNGIIFLKNANTTGFADIALNYGLAGDMPVTGDWNNDGIDTIGVYRNAQFMLRNSNTIGFAEIVFALGNPGDMPISGNWDGIP